MDTFFTFHYHFKQLRVSLRGSTPWFVLKDICELIGLGSPTIVAKNLVSDVLDKSNVGKLKHVWTISEIGLSTLLSQSDNPNANEIRKWITSEVIPALAHADELGTGAEEFANGRKHTANDTQANAIRTFDYGKRQIRAFMSGGEPWFFGNDVAEVLAYVDVDKAISMHVSSADKTMNASLTPKGAKEVLINEFGLYHLANSSKYFTAKKFKEWIIAEVIPSLRRDEENSDVGNDENIYYKEKFMKKNASTNVIIQDEEPVCLITRGIGCVL